MWRGVKSPAHFFCSLQSDFLFSNFFYKVVMKTLATYPWGTIILSAVGSFIASTVWYMLLVGSTDPAVHWITIPVILGGLCYAG